MTDRTKVFWHTRDSFGGTVDGHLSIKSGEFDESLIEKLVFEQAEIIAPKSVSLWFNVTWSNIRYDYHRKEGKWVRSMSDDLIGCLYLIFFLSIVLVFPILLRILK